MPYNRQETGKKPQTATQAGLGTVSGGGLYVQSGLKAGKRELSGPKGRKPPPKGPPLELDHNGNGFYFLVLKLSTWPLLTTAQSTA